MNKFRNIAYIETDLDLLYLVKLTLEKDGYSVRTYDCAQQFLDDLDYRPDLILLDVCMAEMDGEMLYLKLKESPNLAKIPVFFFTAQIAQADIERYKKLGVDKVISKPLDPCKLTKLIEDSDEKE